MARGKEAIKSANRRYEAAIEHIDRLTTELVEAKARARSFEKEATRAAVLDEEIGRLRRQVDEETNDRLDDLRSRLEAAIADAEARIDGMAELLKTVLDRHDGHLSRSEWVEFRRCFGRDLSEWNPDLFNSRHHRRNTSTPGQFKKLWNAYSAIEQRAEKPA